MGISTSNSNWVKYIRRIFNGEQLRVTIDGLDNSGKTTLIHILTDDHMVNVGQHRPHEATFDYINKCFVCLEVGIFSSPVRRQKKQYYDQADACIWMVDSVDHQRMDEARQEMFLTLDDDRLRHLPVVILANKQDRPEAFNKEKLTEVLQLNNLKQRWNIVEMSIIRRHGFKEAFAWLAKELTVDSPTLWSLLSDTVTWMAFWRSTAVKPIAEECKMNMNE